MASSTRNDPRTTALADVRKLAAERDRITAELAGTVAKLEAAMIAATDRPARCTHAEVARAAGLHRSRVSQIVGAR